MSFFQIHQVSIFHFEKVLDLAKGIDVAQPIWLSGCPEKGHFSAKNTTNAFLALK